jgi:hypothetical protein
MVLAIFAIVGLISWIVVMKLQKTRRYPIARKLLEEKRQELGSDFNELAKKVGHGYFHETKVVNGTNYYIGYQVSRPEEIKDSNRAGELVDAIVIEGYVDCVTILPFIYFKTGPSFKETIEKKFEIHKTIGGIPGART